MRRLIVSLSVVVVLLVGVVATLGSGSHGPRGRAGYRRHDGDGYAPGCRRLALEERAWGSDSLYLRYLSRGRHLRGSHRWRRNRIGAWQPTGERTLVLTAFFQDTDPSVEGFSPERSKCGTLSRWTRMERRPRRYIRRRETARRHGRLSCQPAHNRHADPGGGRTAGGGDGGIGGRNTRLVADPPADMKRGPGGVPGPQFYCSAEEF